MTPLPDTRADLVSMTHPELERFLTDLGKERYRATQVMKWIHQGLTESFQSMTSLSMSFREEISSRALIKFPKVLKILESFDGTSKFLLGLADGCAIESVLIPGDDHETLCVSIQVGCSMGCRICQTAQMGLFRNVGDLAYLPVATTGNLMRFVESAFDGFVERSPTARRACGIYGTLIIGFTGGALIGAFASRAWGAHAIWLAAGLLAVTLVLFIVDERYIR